MKKVKFIFGAFLLLLVGVLSLASCSGGTGVTEEDVQITLESKTSKSITLKVAFNTQNKNLSSGTSKVHIKAYLVDGETETYKADNDVKYSDGITTTLFSSLTSASTYHFRVYVTTSGTDYEIYNKDSNKITFKTTSSTPTEADAVEIKTIDDFNNMKNDPSSYYKLTKDLDFGGITLTQKFSDSTPFTGVFDGQGYTLKNFTLYSTKYTGLIEYAKNATIKNVNVEDVKLGVDSTYSISQSYAGSLVGYAYRTLITDCNAKNVTIKVSPSSYSSGKTYTGGVIGQGDTVTIKNVNLSNASVEINQARSFVYAGLFAGSLEKNGLTDSVVCDNCFAEGKLNAYCYFNSSSEGEVVVGGFVGNAPIQAPIQNSLTNVDITVTKYIVSSTNYDKFNLYVGGFVGSNTAGVSGGLNIKKCVSINKIKMYAGKLTGEETEEPDFSNNQFTVGYLDSKEYLAYVGGFLGSTGLTRIEGIDTCAVVFKNEATPLYINGKKVLVTETPVEGGAEGEVDRTEKTLVFSDNFAGYVQNQNDIKNCFTSLAEDADYTVFSQAIQKVITANLVSTDAE